MAAKIAPIAAIRNQEVQEEPLFDKESDHEKQNEIIRQRNNLNDQEHLRDLIIKIHLAKKELREYLEEANIYKADHKIGGNEGRAIKFALAQLDADGDGKLTDEELIQLEETSKENVEKTLGLLLNSGVVGALILSMLYSLTFTTVTYQDKSVEFFGERLCDFFYYVMMILINLATASSFILIFFSTRVYTHLAFWLCTTSAKLKYMSEVKLSLVAGLAMIIMFFAILAIPFAAAVLASPGAGLISAIIVGITTIFIFWYYIEFRIGLQIASRIGVEETEVFLGIKRRK